MVRYSIPALFVGGPLDGHRRDVRADQFEYFAREHEPIACVRPDQVDSIATSTDVRYEAMYMGVEEDELIRVFAPTHWTPLHVITRLIQGYRPPEPDALELAAAARAAGPEVPY